MYNATRTGVNKMSWTEMTAWGMVVFFCATVAFTLTDIRDDVAELTFAEQVK